jgi:hypothetical protein
MRGRFNVVVVVDRIAHKSRAEHVQTIAMLSDTKRAVGLAADASLDAQR